MNVDKTDWRAMTDADRLKHLEIEGYVVLPNLIDAATIAQIKAECAEIGRAHV